jgi:probable HAF family extracellular repeat protein
MERKPALLVCGQAVFAIIFTLILFRTTAGGQQAAPSAGSVSVASWMPLAEIAASSNENALNFGQSVSVSGNAAVVGSDEDASFTGAAYVFVKSSGVPGKVNQTAKLTASDGLPGDAFGFSVSMSGNIVVVGASGADGLQGKVYVFVKPPSGWVDMTETAQLAASDGQANDQLGTSVSISGNTIVAGSPVHMVGSNAAQGAAYVFVQPVGGWTNMTQTAELTASDGVTNGRLGFSIAISNDTVAAGDWNTGTGGGGGIAYVFVEPSGGWANMTQTAELTDTKQNGIGYSVAISGTTIATGSPTGKISGSNVTGVADVFVRPGAGWMTTSQPNATLSPSDGKPGDRLGFSVATTGGTVVAGAPYAHCGGNNCRTVGPGIVYTFAKPSKGWSSMTQSQELTPSDGKSKGFFGQSVAADGPGVLVGAIGTNTAYVYTYAANAGFTAFSVPGSTSTYAYGINNNGQIVGSYSNDSNCFPCGFLYQNTTSTTITYPGAAWTNASDINDSGEVVGYYNDALGATHGFTEVNGTFTSIDYPGALTTFVGGLNNLGDVVGTYADSNDNSHGFLYSNGLFTSIDVPSAENTVVWGINDDDVLGGSYCDAPCQAGSPGFVYSNGTFTAVNYPGATGTSVLGIDKTEDLTGEYGNSRQSGSFVFWNQLHQFVGFNIGDPNSSVAHSINGSGEIVGFFKRGSVGYGFFGHLPGH